MEKIDEFENKMDACQNKKKNAKWLFLYNNNSTNDTSTSKPMNFENYASCSSRSKTIVDSFFFHKRNNKWKQNL